MLRFASPITLLNPDNGRRPGTQVDGSVRLADKAQAELARIANLPNLKVGRVAPEVSGEDLDDQPLRMEGRPFALLGVNSDAAEDREKARTVAREKRMTWRSWWDGGFRGAIQTANDVDHWPTVDVLDPGA